MSISLPEPASPPESFVLSFRLPFALKSYLNVRALSHWAARKRYRDTLAHEVLAAIGGPRYLPRPPIAHARVTIVRHSHQTCDDDNLNVSVKGLLDVLCAPSRTHPAGLGVIEDDRPANCQLIATQERGRLGTTVTVVAVDMPVDAMSERRVPRQVSEMTP